MKLKNRTLDGEGQLIGQKGLTIDANGSVFVADNNNNIIALDSYTTPRCELK